MLNIFFTLRFRIVERWVMYPRLFYCKAYSQRIRRNLRPLKVFPRFSLDFVAFPSCTRTPPEVRATFAQVRKTPLRVHAASAPRDESAMPSPWITAKYCSTFSVCPAVVQFESPVLKPSKIYVIFFVRFFLTKKWTTVLDSFHILPESTVLDVLPNFSYISCLVHL